jgi:hypothetical protein
MSARRTSIDMSAERGRAATLDRLEDLQVLPSQPTAALLYECLSGSSDHVGHLQRRPIHLML